ncbi:uncharacterized protein [Penaeus vannamei]|uniref:uncharacterized protein isoform X2 n=1 Tax=Penaeus vannamei TaxID=6689 RepID=UPI00387F55F8
MRIMRLNFDQAFSATPLTRRHVTESRTQARESRMGENDGGNAWHQRPQTPATWHCLGPRQPIDTRRLPDLYHSPVTPPRPLHLVLGYAPRACPWAPSRPASSRSGRDAAIKDVARISRMEPRPSSPSVIELVLDVKLEYEVTFATRRRIPHRPTAPSLPSQVPHLQGPRIRPVATVHPANFNRKRDPSEENEPRKGDFEFSEKVTTTDVQEQELEPDDRPCKEENPPQQEAVQKKTSNNQPTVSSADSCDKEENKPETDRAKETTDHSYYFSTRYRSYRFRPQEVPDPCKKHRDVVLSARYRLRKALKMECQDGHGCASEDQPIEGQREETQREGQRDITITECLEEFLAELHLSHLADYLRVLGCTCVRDLRLLESSELEAIQLVSRRRLLQQLDSLKLHHEDSSFCDSCLPASVISQALSRSSFSPLSSSNLTPPPSPPPSAPPEDCSLEGWLTWYGLTHISGFLKAIGVHTVGDLAYVREEDLVLLKPVTRRRILACNKRMH